MEVCSYCQRDFGTISIKGLPISKTIDHIYPKALYAPRHGKKSGGISKNLTGDPDNLVICCDECNNLKSDMTLEQLYNFLEHLSIHVLHQYYISTRYLTKELIKTILNSITILQINDTNLMNCYFLET